MPLPILELLFTAVSLLVLIGYHVVFYWRFRRKPLTTSLGLAHHLRGLWVETVMTAQKDILAVQTLRNWTMTATFLASTAIFLGLAVLNAALSTGKLSSVVEVLHLVRPVSETFMAVKLIVLGVDFLLAFFNFTLALRYYNHTGFQINIPAGQNPNETQRLVAETLNRGGLHYTLGMRGYYLAIPLSLWMFGSLWFLLGSLLLVAVLARLDAGQ